MKTKKIIALLMLIVLASCTTSHKARHPDKWMYDGGTKKYYKNQF